MVVILHQGFILTNRIMNNLRCLWLFALTIFLGMAASCRRDDPFASVELEECLGKTVVSIVKGRTGRITSSATISYHYPGTYDSVDLGVLCAEADIEKADSLRKLKDNPEVIFDGIYFALDERLDLALPAGTTGYHLKVMNVRLKE